MFLPTIEDCYEICEKTKVAVRREDQEETVYMTAFQPKIHVVDGVEVICFNYGL